VEATIKYVKRATTEGWDASAMQVRPDGEGTKKDWNDLLKDHLDWAGDPDKAPLSPGPSTSTATTAPSPSPKPRATRRG
jgi:hypothetical protein